MWGGKFTSLVFGKWFFYDCYPVESFLQDLVPSVGGCKAVFAAFLTCHDDMDGMMCQVT